jgi:hypothetical protein
MTYFIPPGMEQQTVHYAVGSRIYCTQQSENSHNISKVRAEIKYRKYNLEIYINSNITSAASQTQSTQA